MAIQDLSTNYPVRYSPGARGFQAGSQAFSVLASTFLDYVKKTRKDKYDRSLLEIITKESSKPADKDYLERVKVITSLDSTDPEQYRQGQSLLAELVFDDNRNRIPDEVISKIKDRKGPVTAIEQSIVETRLKDREPSSQQEDFISRLMERFTTRPKVQVPVTPAKGPSAIAISKERREQFESQNKSTRALLKDDTTKLQSLVSVDATKFDNKESRDAIKKGIKYAEHNKRMRKKGKEDKFKYLSTREQSFFDTYNDTRERIKNYNKILRESNKAQRRFKTGTVNEQKKVVLTEDGKKYIPIGTGDNPEMEEVTDLTPGDYHIMPDGSIMPGKIHKDAVKGSQFTIK